MVYLLQLDFLTSMEIENSPKTLTEMIEKQVIQTSSHIVFKAHGDDRDD